MPLRVMFELTYECNFRCKHCYIPEKYRRQYRSRQLKTERVFDTIRQLKDAGCLYLGFTGGEPLVRPDIMRILAFAKKQGFQVIVYSNGSLFTHKAVDQIADIQPNKVDITIPGMSNSVFERITGMPGSRDAVFGGIRLLHQHKISLGFKTCFLNENHAEIKKIQAFARSLGAEHRLDPVMSRRLNGEEGPFIYRKELPSGKIKKVSSCVSDGQRRLPVTKREKNNLFPCGVGRMQAAITPAGELKLCVMIDHPKYSLDTEPFSSAWKRMQMLVSGIKPGRAFRCPECALRPHCIWCPARAWSYNKTFVSCDPRMREWAEKVSYEHCG